MDLFLAGCQGLGLALAAGVLAGAAGRRRTLGTAVAIVAIAAGAALFGISLSGEDHPAWPGFPVGGLAAAFALVVSRDVAEAARHRAGLDRGEAGTGAGTSETEARRSGADMGPGALIAAAAVALAALSLLVPPLSLAALLGLLALAVGRRRREARKYAGLRVLR